MTQSEQPESPVPPGGRGSSPHDGDGANGRPRELGGRRRMVLWVLVALVAAVLTVYVWGAIKKRKAKRAGEKTKSAKVVVMPTGETVKVKLNPERRAKLLKGIVELERQLAESAPGAPEDPIPPTMERKDFRALWDARFENLKGSEPAPK